MNCPAQNVNCAEDEEPRFTVCKHYLLKAVLGGGGREGDNLLGTLHAHLSS